MDKKLLVLFLIVSLIVPSLYLYWIYHSPDVFIAYNQDDGQELAIMMSVNYNFDNMLNLYENTIFKNFVGPIYLSLILGFIASLLGIDFIVFLVIIKTVFVFLFLFVSYKLAEILIKENGKLIIIPLLATVGIGGILSFFYYSPHLLWGGVFSAFLVDYMLVPLVLSYFSLYFFIRNNIKASFLLSGFSILFYPAIGFFGLLTIFVYSWMFGRIKSFVYVLFSSAFILPWIYIVLLKSEILSSYLDTQASMINPISFVINCFFLVLLSGIGIFAYKKNVVKENLFIITISILVLILFLSPPQFSIWPSQKFRSLIWLPLSLLSLIGINYFFKNRKHLLALAILMLLISSISFLFFVNEKTKNVVYIDKEEYDALLFLKSKPYGSVLAGKELSLYIPYYSEKKAPMGRLVYFTDKELENAYKSINIDFMKSNNIKYYISENFIESDRIDVLYNNSVYIYEIL